MKTFPIKSEEMWSLGEFRPGPCPGGTAPLPRKPFDWFIGANIGRYTNVEAQFEAFITERFTGSMVDRHLRFPWHQWAIGNARANDIEFSWHQDAKMSYVHNYMATWCTDTPTEIRRIDGSGQIYQAAPFEVLVFNNNVFEHRAPAMGRRKWTDRWFMRTFLSDQASFRDLPGLYALEAP